LSILCRKSLYKNIFRDDRLLATQRPICYTLRKRILPNESAILFQNAVFVSEIEGKEKLGKNLKYLVFKTLSSIARLFKSLYFVFYLFKHLFVCDFSI